MRPLLVTVHRWAGLFTAVFLFIAGATGAVIAWDHELDELLNPQLAHALTVRGTQAQRTEILAAAQRFERDNADALVTYMPLTVEHGHALSLYVGARNGDPNGLPYNNVSLDPVTGTEQGRRPWGTSTELSRETLIPWLYKLHYSMHLPNGFGIELGILFMGIVAIVWTFDCFVALALSFPNLTQWRKSFVFRVRAGGYRLVFDLHRSGGVWTWLLMLTLAVTAVSMNLKREVTRPLVSVFSPLSPDIWTSRPMRVPADQVPPALDRAAVISVAEREALRRNIHEPAGGLFHAAPLGMYGVGFFSAGNGHGDGGLSPPWLYFDDQTGAVMGADIPGEGSAGDLFMELQFPLHSGRIGGLWGRALVTVLGLVVALLSGTGIVVWLKKRRARAHQEARARTRSAEEAHA